MNSLVMYSAVITSFFTGPAIIPPQEELEKEVEEPKVPVEEEEEKLVDENSMECFLEFLIEFFN